QAHVERLGAVQRGGPGVDDRGFARVAQWFWCLVAAGSRLVGDYDVVVQQRYDRGVVGGLDRLDVTADQRLLGGGGGRLSRPLVAGTAEAAAHPAAGALQRAVHR